MPSYARQGLRIIKNKNPRKPGTYILIAKKTGYMNVWINGKWYYYNYTEHNVNPNKINIEKIIEDVEAQEQRRRGVIVIRKR